VSAQRLLTKNGQHATMIKCPTFDHSGWTPRTLELLVDLAARLPFEEAALVATNFGLNISKSDLERLTAPIANACREVTFETLKQAEPEPLQATSTARLMVLEVDGVMVLGKPLEGRCEGIEIKTVTLYPFASPSERLIITDVRHPEELKDAIRLVGVGDGAAWVEDILDSFCTISVTDCFHAAGYLEVVMSALGWPETRRLATRRAFCRGEVDVAAFLSENLPSPEVWLAWDEEALVALRYLEHRKMRMRYPMFKQQGFPIGSGVVEGLNKSVIGTRMKRSGMHWSRPGAARMAVLRSWLVSKRKIVSFDSIRHVAYPPPSLESLESSP
jgi:hypothetical protein